MRFEILIIIFEFAISALSYEQKFIGADPSNDFLTIDSAFDYLNSIQNVSRQLWLLISTSDTMIPTKSIQVSCDCILRFIFIQKKNIKKNSPKETENLTFFPTLQNLSLDSINITIKPEAKLIVKNIFWQFLTDSQINHFFIIDQNASLSLIVNFYYHFLKK